MCGFPAVCWCSFRVSGGLPEPNGGADGGDKNPIHLFVYNKTGTTSLTRKPPTTEAGVHSSSIVVSSAPLEQHVKREYMRRKDRDDAFFLASNLRGWT